MTNDSYSKVPEVTLGFWAIKIIATTLGEVGGNAVSTTLQLGYLKASLVLGVPLIGAIVAQIKTERFSSLLYWATITLTTLAGTTLADFFDRSIGIGYSGGSLALLVLVVATLAAWKGVLGSVDIRTVTTARAEGFYWTTIMFSQTLGTALGDWMADSAGLGYNGSALLIAVVLAFIAGLYLFSSVSHIFLFWAAFVLTRPLGATIANSLDKPVAQGGLAVNDIAASIVFAAVMVICVAMIPQRAGRH